VVRTLDGHAVDIAVCGEMGGRQLEALALIGVGIERLSITPAAVGPLKAMIAQCDVAAIRAAMEGWLAAPPPNLRQVLSDWAAERGILVD
jgi:phosphotransferase system enzyme I (PtsP)